MQRPDLSRAAFYARQLLVIVACFTACDGLIASARAQSGTVVTEHSRVYVFVAKKGAGHDHGVEGRVASGEIHLDRAQNPGKLTFQLQSLAADTSAARKFFKMDGETDNDTQAAVNANMHGTSILDIAQFPTAEYVISQLQEINPDPNRAAKQYQLDGEFTLHGVKRALRVNATGEIVNGLIRLRGQFPLKQTDYSIKPFSKLLGAIGIQDELKVYGDIWLNP